VKVDPASISSSTSIATSTVNTKEGKAHICSIVSLRRSVPLKN
jgi:hypothetical protein